MGEHAKEWRHYRRLVAYNIAAFLVVIPFTWGATVLSEKLLHKGVLFPYFAGFSVAIWLISGLRVSAFNCPRCQKCFIGSWWYGNYFFVNQCAHCGLPRESKVLSWLPIIAVSAIALALVLAAVFAR
jgi:hypothetical protein